MIGASISDICNKRLIMHVSFSSLILTLSYSLYLPDNSHDPRHDMCRSTCDDRLQSAAFDSTMSSSISPSSLNTLFLTQGSGSDESSTYQNTSNNNQQSSVSSRPRRLPQLIKILTGFDDEPYWNVQSSDSSSDSNSRPIIARIDIPHFARPSQPSAGSDPVRDTVQLAAAAAATAVWSKSIRIFGNHRMQRVNSEWDAALRWIAGWDQKQRQMGIGERNEPRTKVDEHSTSLGGGATGFNTFVDDLAKMLESCMKQCLVNKDFDTRLGKSDEGSSDEIAMRKSLIGIGDTALRSFFGLITSLSFSRLSLDQLISAQSRFILGRTVQLVASSVGVYAIHSMWVWASPTILTWYSSLGYTESPEWLLEHEKEIQVAKKPSRQKKKSKRRQMTKQAGKHRSKQQTPSKDEMQKERRAAKETASSKDYLDPKHLVKNNEPPPEPEKSMPMAEEQASNIITSKDSPSLISEISVPSLISYPTITSASSSPSCKPIGTSHLEDGGVRHDDSLLPESYHSTLGLASSQVGSSHGPVFTKLSHQNGLRVPTQAQRDQAAQRLREFQNAQIQRLLLKKKLAQSCVATSSTAQRSGLQPDGNSFNISSASQPSKKVFKPPPGLSHPSAEAQYVLPTQGGADGFLTDNELFLSKLLDDEEDDDEGGGVKKPASSLQIHVPSMSPEPESSLDPAAAPFVRQMVATEESPKPKREKGDIWQSDSGEISLREESSSKMIKGAFYGGSVW